MLRRISENLIKISNAIKHAEAMPSSMDLKNLKIFLKELGQTEAKKLLDMKCAYDKESKLNLLSKGMLTLLAFFVLKGMSQDEINKTTFQDFNTHWKNLTVDEKEDLSDLEKKSKELLKQIQEDRLKSKKDTVEFAGPGSSGIDFIYPK